MRTSDVDPSRRDQVLTTLKAVLREIMASGDPTRASADGLTQLARDLAAASPDIDHDLQARWAIGLLHWLRSQALLVNSAPSANSAVSEIELAAQWLRPLMASARQMVPEPLQPLLDDAPVTDVASHMRRAHELLNSYQRTGSLLTLLHVITIHRRVIAAVGPTAPYRVTLLMRLGQKLRTLFERTEDVSVLREAVEVSRDAASLSSGQPYEAECLFLLGEALRTLFERTSDVSVLREAVEVASRMAAFASPDVLREAAEVASRMAASASPDDPDPGTHLFAVGTSLWALFELTQELHVLREAVDIFRQAVAATSSGDSRYAMRLPLLGIALRRLYRHTEELPALLEAITIYRQLVTMIQPDDPDRAGELFILGELLRLLSHHDSKLETVQAAVAAYRQAVDSARPDDPDHALYVAMLASSLFRLYDETGQYAILQEALQTYRSAVDLTPPHHPRYAERLSGLAITLLSQYEQTGQLAALQEAMETSRKAVDAATAGTPEYDAYLSNLSLILLQHYQQTADLDTLKESIQAAQSAVNATSPDSSNRGPYLSTLAQALFALFERTGELAALQTAVQAGRDATAAIPSNHHQRARLLAQLGIALRTLFGRTGKPELLDEAVQTGRDAVAATSPDNSHRPSYLSHLGNTLMLASIQTGELGLMEEAVRAGRDAVGTIPSDHAFRAGCLSNFCHVARVLFEQTGDVAVLEEAVRAGRDAVAGSAADHPLRAISLGNLANALRMQFAVFQDATVLREAGSLFAAVARMSNASAARRIWAAQDAASLDLLASDHGSAIAMIELAIELLPRLSSRDLGRADRESQVSSVFGLAATAAAVAIAAGNPAQAVEWLEQTRGLVFAETLNTRSDLTDLSDRAPDLAAQLDDLRRAIDAADHEAEMSADADPSIANWARYRELAARRAQLNEQWQNLLAQIRGLTGLAGFLRPPSIDELRRHAAPGPIVYVTVHGTRGHALIVTDQAKRPVHIIDLPAVTSVTAAEHAAVLREAREIALDPQQSPHERRTAQRRILSVLDWLWDTIAKPVLRHLGHTTPPEPGRWPRIWWCPVSVIASLPLHAAGQHTMAPHTAAVMDRVISSYTPTIRALANARTPPPPPSANTRPMVIIAVSDAPDAPALDGVDSEAHRVHNLIPLATVVPTAGTKTSHEAITEQLRQHRIAHFACHGITDEFNPAASRLLLHDHLTHPLTLHTISGLRLTDAHLAYLAACSTNHASVVHADEATHITTAFQLAGYCHVIGTIWPINDAAATTIAEDFYARLTNATTSLDTALAAQALHHTIRHHRDQYPTLPTRWAAYLHTGA